MTHPAERRNVIVRYLPGPAAVWLAVLGTATGWLVALGGLVGTVALLPDLSWPGTIFPLLLCGSPPTAWWATRRVMTFRRVRHRVPDEVLDQRHHGDLSAIDRSGQRPLRPIGATVGEVAERTDDLLTALTTVPNVRIFRGFRPAGTTLPLTSHAVSAGRTLILVESVAWPPGWYRTGADGRIHCDGQYIGQSVEDLLAAIRSVQAALPRRHRVSALVVVYRTGTGRYALPTATGELAWMLAGEAPRYLAERLARDPVTVSRHAVAALRSGLAGQGVPA
jgi:hypothetical protein